MIIQELKKSKVAGRIFWAIIFAILGFYVIYLWFISAFIVWTIFSDFEEVKREQEFRRKNPPSPRPTPASSGITLLPEQEGTDWKWYFVSLCESPAETAFLEAMIEYFDLIGKIPTQRINFDPLPLSGKDITLKLQVPLPPYRVDFLVDEFLVVEIDGAAYHSSPEAVQRDCARDRVLEERGFTVLRIPAKVVFNHPEDAVRRVREANAARKQVEEAKAKLPKDAAPTNRGEFGSLGNFLTRFNEDLDDLSKNITQKSALQDAMQKPNMVFFKEKLLVDNAINMSKFDIEFKQNMTNENFSRIYDSLTSKIEKRRFERGEPKEEAFVPSRVEDFPPQSEHPDPTIQQEIARAYQALVEERRRFFEETQETLQKYPALEQLVDKRLTESCNTHILGHIWFGV